MTKHLIALTRLGFTCSCGEKYDASERSIMRRKGERPFAGAAQHQLAALIQESLNGGEAIVTNCLACNAESSITVAGDETLAAYAKWLQIPCVSCGKTPTDVAKANTP